MFSTVLWKNFSPVAIELRLHLDFQRCFFLLLLLFMALTIRVGNHNNVGKRVLAHAIILHTFNKDRCVTAAIWTRVCSDVLRRFGRDDLHRVWSTRRRHLIRQELVLRTYLSHEDWLFASRESTCKELVRDSSIASCQVRVVIIGHRWRLLSGGPSRIFICLDEEPRGHLPRVAILQLRVLHTAL